MRRVGFNPSHEIREDEGIFFNSGLATGEIRHADVSVPVRGVLSCFYVLIRLGRVNDTLYSPGVNLRMNTTLRMTARTNQHVSAFRNVGAKTVE